MFRKTLLILILLSSSLALVKGQTPLINKKIIEYVTLQIGKKVDRGECWDLAYEALTLNNCKWDGKYAFGKKLNQRTDSIYPGDIIQFEDVVIRYQEKNVSYNEAYSHHTAIIYEVLGKGYYKIAHQNFGNKGKVVTITELKLSYKTSGNLFFYRPVAKGN